MISPSDVHIFCLLYGNYPKLHRRLITRLQDSLPKETPVTCWLNQTELKFPCDYEIIQSEINVPKYITMRKMWEQKLNLNHKWFVWFDDDTKITNPNWFTKALQKINSTENIAYLGQAWSSPYAKGQEEFIKQSTWYKNKPFKIINNKHSSRFAQGSYWWIRKDIIKILNWPDPRLEHNGGDILLGEAIHQNDIKFHHFPYGCFGVQPNCAERRGINQVPPGWTPEK